MLEQLLNVLDLNNVINETQHGFRKNNNTITAIHSFYQKVLNAIEVGEDGTRIFYDLSRAFDCVNHELPHYVIFGIPQNCFQSYLRDRP